MSAVQTALGIVVGGLDYGEADRIVTFVTRERGRLRGIARSARRSRRRFGAALELLAKVRVRYVERPHGGLVRLEGCDLVNGYPGLRADLRRLAAATYAAELVREAAQDEEPIERLFDLLGGFLTALANEDPGPGWVRTFELRALEALGWLPELSRCAGCAGTLPEEGVVQFHAARGGTVCGRCGAGSRGWPLSPGTLRTLRECLADSRVTFTRAAVQESAGPMVEFIEQHLGKRLRSRDFLVQMEQ